MNKNLVTYSCLLLAGLYSLTSGSLPQACAQARRGDAAKVLPLDPAVRTGKLPNGFTYYIRHNQEPKNRVVLYLVNKVGSILEDEDQRGLAHFMEHMSFNGTKHYPKNELVDYLQKSGVRFGADLNAYTGFDETVYQLPLPTDDPRVLKHGMQIMRDWAQEATLDPLEIDKERGVVLEEKRLGRGAQERMQRVFFPVLLNHSRYAERLPIGLEDVLVNFKPEAIRRYYKDWYRPDLQALIVVGDIDAAKMQQLIERQFSDLKNPLHEKPRVKYTTALTAKNQFVEVTDKEMPSTVAEVLIKHKSMPLKTAADYRVAMLHELFNQMVAERYSELSREADPPFIEASAGIEGLMGGLEAYNLTMVARPGELQKAFKAGWGETERIRRFGFTAGELDRAKATYLSRMESALHEKGKTPSESYVKEYVQHFLNGVASPGIDKEYELVSNGLPGISLEELNHLAQDYIRPVDRDLLVLAPEKDKGSLPSEAVMEGWMKETEQEPLSPYKDETNKQALLSAAPTPGKITSEKKDAALGMTELTLSNGLRVLLKPTDFKNDEILFAGVAPGGTSLYDDGDFQSAANAANLVASFGAGNYSLTDLEKFLSGKVVKVQPFISERYQGVMGEGAPRDLETMLQLTYCWFTVPRKDTTVFRGIMERSRAALKNRANDPVSMFKDTVAAVLGGYNLRRTGPTPEKLDQISLDRSLAIFRERYADASGFTFIFVGSFDPAAIKPLLEKYLGSLPSAYRKEQARNLGIHIPAGRIEKTVYKGSEPRATVRLVYSGEFAYSAEHVLALDALKECLEIRLLERLREDESGVYSPGVQVAAGKYPDGRFSLTVQFGCAPGNVDKLVASTLEEVAKLRMEGPPEVNLEKYKAEKLRTDEVEQKTNKYWLNYLTDQLNNGEDMEEMLHGRQQVMGLNTGAVKAMAQQCLSGENYIRLVLLPESNQKAK